MAHVALALGLLWAAASERILPPHPEEEKFDIDRLPIEFLVEEAAPTLVDGDTHWFCVKIRLLPEDGGDKYAVLATRLGDSGKQVYRMDLTPRGSGHKEAIDGTQTYKLQLGAEAAASKSPYRDPRSKDFIATRHAEEDGICNKLGGVYTRFADLQAYVHERMTKKNENGDPLDVEPQGDRDVLETHIKNWNKKWARPPSPGGEPNGCKTQQECSGFHVSYAKVPDALQQRFVERLLMNWTLFFDTEGAGIAGTTGARFAAGNRGYRFPHYGQERLDNLFPNDEDKKLFEESLSKVVLAREDLKQEFGNGMEIDFQHRLWRYGPDFPVRGGIWHRDTCPFGIGGQVPEGGWQLTSVFVMYAYNLDLSQSGTRLKDRFGKTHDMPCIPGTMNIMHSGENKGGTPWHAGPVLRKVNGSMPAYRVMVQSKMVIRAAAHKVPMGAETWGALGFADLPKVEPAEEKAALVNFFRDLSQALAWGASESNAVGSEAYPINAQRAWARTEELAGFLGFRGGFLPTFAKPPVDVEDENVNVPSEKGPKDVNEPDFG